MAVGEPKGAVQRLVAEFARLPGIGPKTAERLAHHLLESASSQLESLAAALLDLKQNVHRCKNCCNPTEGELCSICADPRRDPTQVCVVELPKDLTALERAAVYKGQYHVLWGQLAPLDGVGPEHLTIDALLRRVKEQQVQEVILATNPTLEGDGTALYISNLLAGSNVKITRLARGLAAGSHLEFANRDALADALVGRREY
jgi:recombination protein RecR